MSGMYTFFAENGDASASITFNITVKGKFSVHCHSTNILKSSKKEKKEKKTKQSVN